VLSTEFKRANGAADLDRRENAGGAEPRARHLAQRIPQLECFAEAGATRQFRPARTSSSQPALARLPRNVEAQPHTGATPESRSAGPSNGQSQRSGVRTFRRRLAICGTPDECLAQVRAARAAGVRRLMVSVSLAVDPLATVRLFGEKVLPAVRS